MAYILTRTLSPFESPQDSAPEIPAENIKDLSSLILSPEMATNWSKHSIIILTEVTSPLAINIKSSLKAK